MAHNRQSKAKSAVQSRQPAVRLAKSVENVRKEIRRDSFAGVADCDFNVRVNPTQIDLDASVSGREFDCVRDQIPNNLLQSIRIAGDQSDVRVQHRLYSYA